jgi:hypothetical protein
MINIEGKARLEYKHAAGLRSLRRVKKEFIRKETIMGSIARNPLMSNKHQKIALSYLENDDILTIKEKRGEIRQGVLVELAKKDDFNNLIRKAHVKNMNDTSMILAKALNVCHTGKPTKRLTKEEWKIVAKWATKDQAKENIKQQLNVNI